MEYPPIVSRKRVQQSWSAGRPLLLIAACALAAWACVNPIDLVQGRVTAEVAGHHVIVTDCYRTSPPGPERLPDENGAPVYRYAPCKDAVVILRGTDLTVNGTAYGTLGDGDEIVVDHGRVLINGNFSTARRSPDR